ncbi:MAG: hypothetical protein IJY99_04165 [Alphaproteobacteria bacterium]|nr:hypothetical protein [Alphaproteobacteria bacterium]
MSEHATPNFEILRTQLEIERNKRTKLLALAKSDQNASKSFIRYTQHIINICDALINTIHDTKEWLSASDLIQIPEFPIKDKQAINIFLTENKQNLYHYQKNDALPNTIISNDDIAIFIMLTGLHDIKRRIYDIEMPLIHRDAVNHLIDYTNTILNNWLTPADLLKNKALNTYDIKDIKRFLDDAKQFMPKDILKFPSEYYLNRNNLYDFIRYVTKGKTVEWLSIDDIVQTHPLFKDYKKIEIYGLLTNWQKTAPNDVQERLNPNKRFIPTLCLRATKIDDFVKFITEPEQEAENNASTQQKTHEQKTKWLSPSKLSKDKNFPLTDIKTINQTLARAQALMPNDIQFQKNKRGEISLCLRSTAKATLANMTELPPLPQKTSQWLSTTDLRQLPNIQLNPQTIRGKLEMAQRLMPNDIRFFQAYSTTALCLRATKVNEFLKITNTENIPPKTSEWLSNVDLTKEPGLHIKSSQTIGSLLTELQTYMPDHIQMRKPKTGIASLCIHKDAKNKLISIANAQQIKRAKDSQNESGKQKHLDKQMDTIAWALAGKNVNNPDTANKLIFDMYEKLHYENY